LCVGSQGQLPQWDKEFEEIGPRPRHLSHLLGLYPGRQSTPLHETVCRRRPIALGLVAGGQPFGRVAEALVTIGHPLF